MDGETSQLSRPSADRQRSYDGGYMAVGKNGEEIVMAWIANHPQTLGVDDVRELRVTRDADIDCFIKTQDGRVTLAEIKTDQHLGVSGNVLFEVLRINHTAPPDRAVTLGWAARSPARTLFYYAPSVSAIYICRFDALRLCFQKWSREARGKMRINVVPTDNIKTTVNVLIPWAAVSDIFQIKRADG